MRSVLRKRPYDVECHTGEGVGSDTGGLENYGVVLSQRRDVEYAETLAAAAVDVLQREIALADDAAQLTPWS